MKRSHVKIASANYSRNMIVKRQLTVQCHVEDMELVHEWYIRTCDSDTSRLVEFGDLLSRTSYDCLRFVGVDE